MPTMTPGQRDHSGNTYKVRGTLRRTSSSSGTSPSRPRKASSSGAPSPPRRAVHRVRRHGTPRPGELLVNHRQLDNFSDGDIVDRLMITGQLTGRHRLDPARQHRRGRCPARRRDRPDGPQRDLAVVRHPRRRGQSGRIEHCEARRRPKTRCTGSRSATPVPVPHPGRHRRRPAGTGRVDPGQEGRHPRHADRGPRDVRRPEPVEQHPHNDGSQASGALDSYVRVAAR